jgi:hypothetical protein
VKKNPPPQPSGTEPARRQLSESDRGAAQVHFMQHLNQLAAAWLMGKDPRVLRDRVDIPRNLDGSYDVRVILNLIVDERVKNVIRSGPDETIRFFEMMGII